MSISNAELVRHLFGNPFDPDDRGLLGDIRGEIKELNKRIDGILRLGWAVLITVIGALGADAYIHYHP